MTWLERMGTAIGSSDPDQVGGALGATLHALRDRLPVHEAAQLGGQLPTFVRGLYYDGWNPSARQEAGLDGNAFVARVQAEAGLADRDGALAATRALGQLLAENVDSEELGDVVFMLPRDLRELIGV